VDQWGNKNLGMFNVSIHVKPSHMVCRALKVLSVPGRQQLQINVAAPPPPRSYSLHGILDCDILITHLSLEVRAAAQYNLVCWDLPQDACVGLFLCL